MPTPKITTYNLPAGLVGHAYLTQLQATGGSAPLKWSVNPSLPCNLTLDDATGTISGIPCAPTSNHLYSFTVTDNGGAKDAASLSLMVGTELMSQGRLLGLAGYLLVALCVAGYFIYSLWYSPSTLPASEASTFAWTLFGRGHWKISLEAQLLLLILNTGAFGSSLYALKSLADYQGQEELYKSWLLYYAIQPFEGAGVAFLLYVAVRAGFLATSVSEVKAVNQFGMCAIAGLAGAFSDTAFMKLREVFQTLFKPQDNRGDKVAALKILSAGLVDGVNGQPYKQVLQAANGAAPLNWTVSPPLPPALALDPTTGTISGVPATAVPKTMYTFSVADSGSPQTKASAIISLQIN